MSCAAAMRLFTTAALAVGIAGCGSPTAPPPPPPPPPTFTVACMAPEPVQSPDDNPVAVTFAPPVAQGGVAPISTTCSAQSGAAFPVGTTTVTCTATDARGVSAACSFPVRVNPAPRLVGPRLLAFGDSITWGGASEPIPALTWLFTYPVPPPSHAYPAHLRQRLAARYRFQTIEVINEGWPGEEAQAGGKTRFPHVLQQHQPDIVILMEGTNDLLSLEIGVVRGLEALGEMVREAKRQNVRVLLSTIIPQRMDGFRVPNRNEYAARVPPFNDGVRALAALENVPLVDMHAVFAADMFLIGVDDVHPTEQGYEVMAATFFEAIRMHFEAPPPPVGGLR
jgi:lysophospholipase L1-like esterase